MIVYGKNVARDLLKKNKNIEKIILQDSFNDKEILSLIEKNNIKYKFGYLPSHDYVRTIIRKRNKSSL